MNKLCFHIILIFFLVSACSEKKSTIVTYAVHHSDYIEVINAPGTIQPVTSTTILSPRVNVSNMSVAFLVDDGSYVNKGDTICILDAPELIFNYESQKNDLEKLQADMIKLEADNAMELSLLNAQVATNKAQLAITMLDSIQMKFAPPVKQRLIELEMEKANVEKKKLQKKYAAQKKINSSEIIQMKSRIMMQQNRLQMVQQQMSSLTIVSPITCMAMHSIVPVMMFLSSGGGGSFGGEIKVGSSVWSNMALLQLPDMKLMQVSVEVPETDFKRIKESQRVLIRVDGATSLIITGKIKRKTLTGIKTEEKTAIKTYEVIVSLDSCHQKVKPGLSASCRIIVDEVKDTIVIPASAIYEVDSSKIVYVAEDRKFKPVTVETGLSNSSMSIITKGLMGDETIALMKPSHNLLKKEIKSKTSFPADSARILADTTIN